MAIGNLGNKISQDDVNKVKDLRNPPEFEPGYGGGGSDSGGGFDDLQFDSLDGFGDLGFGDDSNNSGGGFGQQSSGFGNLGQQSGGFGQQSGGFGQQGGGFGQQSGGFGQQSNGFSSFGQQSNGFGGFGQQGGIQLGQNPFMTGQNQQAAQQKPDFLDTVFDASGKTAITFGNVMMELFGSLKNRNADDFGYISRNMIIAGAAFLGSGIVAAIIGAILNFGPFKLGAFPLNLICTGTLSIGAGFIGIGFSAIKISQSTNERRVSLQEVPDVAATESDDSTGDYEDHIGDILDDLFGESTDSTDTSDSIFDQPVEPETETEEYREPTFAAPEPINYEKELEKVDENSTLSRKKLFDTFKNFLPFNTPTFADIKDIDEDDPTFSELEAIALKALSNVAKCDLEEVKSKLESARETFFSYELRLKRIRGVKNTDDIAREMEAYFRESSTDTSVNATVDIEGDFYKVIVTKGESAVVTMGDVFRQEYTCEFFLDTGNKLPIITGIDELGKVILNDAKVYDTMLIAGKPRSGKSWYVLSVLMCLAMFNTPEDVEFIIVDPKESNLFNTFALLPHVAGLHNDKRILEIMDDLIENEAPRRKKLLADNKCDDIWAIRKKGVKLPVLYLVIDEYITVRNNLGALDKELDVKLQTIISQLPSLGIRLLIVPHRATGVVNKTNRTMLQFTASVKGDIEDVKDTLGITKWTRALTKPGDIAIKTSTMQNATYVRGAALTTSDDDNAEMIKNIAKAFYKMGVDLPDNSAMKIAAVRDEDYIRQELQEDGHRVQFSTLNFDKD